MAVFRVDQNNNYSIISNIVLKDKNLSLKAKGLLCTMLGLPDDWDYSLAGLKKLAKDGGTATMTALKELEEHGYLTRKPLREKGKFVDWEYTIYECPHTEKPLVENPNVVKPNVENQGQSNTNKSNTNKSNTNILNNNKNNIYNSEFDELWQLYPRKQGKPNALKAYIKARKKGTTFEEVKQGIENYCKQIEAKGTATEYIKHGSTWFNQEAWGDDYDLKPQKKVEEKQKEGIKYGVVL